MLSDIDRASMADLERATKSVLIQARRNPSGWAQDVETPPIDLSGRQLVEMALLRFFMDREEVPS